MRFAVVAIAVLASAVNAKDDAVDILDKAAEKEYEDFKSKFDKHGSSLLEQAYDAEETSLTDKVQFLAELAEGEKEVKEAEQNVAKLEKTVALMEQVEQQKKMENSMEARVAAVMAVSSKIDALVDDAIMEYLLNPTKDAAPASLVQKPIESDASFINHRIVKMMELEAPEKEIQDVVLDKVLKGLEKQGTVAVASIDLDSLKEDAQVQMNLDCLMAMLQDTNQKLFVDVYGGDSQRRDRVMDMAKMLDPKAQALDSVKNLQAEDYTYKLADSIYKIGDFEKATGSPAKLNEMMSPRAAKVLPYCMHKKSAHKQNQQIQSMYAHKPYFGKTNLIKSASKMSMNQAESKPENKGLAPSMRRASYMM